MCTVILHVPEAAGGPVRLLAIRDEDPGRPWDPLGAWWPETYPGFVGVRDARAGGAWLAADPERSHLSVILNRRDVEGATDSRGTVVLDAAAGRAPSSAPSTNGFNLVDVDQDGARVTSWDGAALRTTRLSPGVHMIAHDEVDDPATPRIARWLPEFAAVPPDSASGAWFEGWLTLLRGSAALDATDDRALVRDNRPHGVPTLSLLMCAASVTPASLDSPGGVDIVYGELDEPGRWNEPALRPPAW